MISNRLSNRQRMINLMYIIFITIAALSISRNVLDGYNTTYENEQIINKNIANTNNEMYNKIVEVLINENGERSEEAIKKLTEVNKLSKEFAFYIRELREEIARLSDEESYEVGKIKNPENMSAVPAVIFDGSVYNGQLLKERLTNYRDVLCGYIHNQEQCDVVDNYLLYGNTQSNKEWDKTLFGNKSTANALKALNNLETGILSSEKIVYAEYIEDLISAKNSMIASLRQADSNLSKKAIVSPMLNDNLFVAVNTKINVFTDGDDTENLVVKTDNGIISKVGINWYVRPTDVNRNVNISVLRMNGNKSVQIGKYSYGVKPLPNPSPYITYIDRKSGKMVEYRGYTPIKKEDLISNAEIRAAMSDLGIDAKFKVIGFQLVCIDANEQVTILESNGSVLTDEQKSKILSLSADDKIHITSIAVMGPDNKRRTISSISALLM